MTEMAKPADPIRPPKKKETDSDFPDPLKAPLWNAVLEGD
jgi:hypothetical protein